jgi:PhzF family phenazine biosynthesis protein
LIELDFPSKPVVPCEKVMGLEESLGVQVLNFFHNGAVFLAELENASTVRQLQPDFKKMESYLNKQFHGVIVTAASDDPVYDFVSRFFAPVAGIPEDFVTGSSHCSLGPFWEKRLHKSAFTAYQASARGGVLRVRCEGDRVYLVGKAVTVVRGELL